MLIPERIEKAKSLFELMNDHNEYKLMSSFECLGNEIFSRTLSLPALKLSVSYVNSQKLLAKTFQSFFLRLSDVFYRLNQLNWMRAEFEKDDSKYSKWNVFAALSIKDFHVDLSSLMDSISPILIQSTIGLKHNDHENFPGFPDIQESSKRTYRKELPLELTTVIDSSATWWPNIKKIRDILAHRDHDKIVFGKPSDGIFFQIYQRGLKASIIDKHLLWKRGHNVVDFYLYSAFAIAEILCFLEEITIILMKHLNISKEGLTHSWRIGNYQYLIKSMDQLIEDNLT